MLASQENLVKTVGEVRDLLGNIADEYELVAITFNDMHAIQHDLEESIQKLTELIFYMGCLHEKLRIRYVAKRKRAAKKDELPRCEVKR